MAIDPKKKKKEPDEEEEDDFADWTSDQPIPDEEGEAAAKRKAIVDLRAAHLTEQLSKQKRKKKSGLW